jgi:osmotically-inducible protein OsmY
MRTDTELLADLQAELSWGGSIDHRDIVVEVENGVVVLAGHVASYADKLKAEAAVKKVAGVGAIANDIEVRLGTPAQRSDREIAEAASNALKSNVSVPAAAVTILVKDGWITLEGKVPLWYQKDAAETAVSNLWGVKGVTNDIQLQSPLNARDIKQKIQLSLERLAAIEADRITIEVHDGIVTLNGEVDSWRERDEAGGAAWSAPGVTNVRNLLSVRP